MSVDLKKYRHHIEHFDLSDSRKDDLLQDLWSFLECFVDEAFGLHPAQQTCGQLVSAPMEQENPALEFDVNSKSNSGSALASAWTEKESPE